MYILIGLLIGIFEVASAQLLVLESDQTLQLPSTSTIWDVIPGSSGNYLLAQAVRRSDDSLIVYWGDGPGGEIDSFTVSRGIPKYLCAFWREDYAPHVVVGWWNYAPNPTWSYARVFRLTDGAPDSLFWNWGGLNYGGFDWQVWYDHYSLSTVVPLPAPPSVTTDLVGVVINRYEYRFWSSPNVHIISWQTTVFPDLLTGSGGSGLLLPGSGSVAAADVSGDTLHLAYAADRFDGTWETYHQTATIFDTVVTNTYGYSSTGASNPTNISCTFRPSYGVPIAAVNESAGLTIYSGSLLLWSQENPSSYANFVDAIPEMPGEEVLYYVGSLHALAVRRAQNGYDYGHTTPVGQGVDMVRVIARKQPAFCRLAVQVGSSITLYRFGEYLRSSELGNLTPRIPLLYECYPNPFNSATSISYDLPRASQVLLNIFDITGRTVATLVEEIQEAGQHQVNFDAHDLPSGIYVYRLSAGAVRQSRKLVILK